MNKIAYSAYLYVLPAFIGCLLFTLYPVVYVLYLSLNKVDLLNYTFSFVAAENYVRLFRSAEFAQVMGNTFIYMIVTVAISCSVSLLLAVLLHRPGRLYNWIQT